MLISIAERFGESRACRWATGELFAINADGGKAEMLAGFRVDDGGLGTTIKPKKGSDSIAALPIDTAPAGDGRMRAWSR